MLPFDLSFAELLMPVVFELVELVDSPYSVVLFVLLLADVHVALVDKFDADILSLCIKSAPPILGPAPAIIVE